MLSARVAWRSRPWQQKHARTARTRCSANGSHQTLQTSDEILYERQVRTQRLIVLFYFVNLCLFHRFKDRLYNCLAGLCLRNSNSLEAMRLDLNPLLIGTYFQRKIHASTQLFGLKGEGKVGEMSLRDRLIRNSEIPSGETKIVCCCVPPSLWGDCVEFFR